MSKKSKKNETATEATEPAAQEKPNTKSNGKGCDVTDTTMSDKRPCVGCGATSGPGHDIKFERAGVMRLCKPCSTKMAIDIAEILVG